MLFVDFLENVRPATSSSSLSIKKFFSSSESISKSESSSSELLTVIAFFFFFPAVFFSGLGSGLDTASTAAAASLLRGPVAGRPPPSCLLMARVPSLMAMRCTRDISSSAGGGGEAGFEFTSSLLELGFFAPFPDPNAVIEDTVEVGLGGAITRPLGPCIANALEGAM